MLVRGAARRAAAKAWAVRLLMAPGPDDWEDVARTRALFLESGDAAVRAHFLPMLNALPCVAVLRLAHDRRTSLFRSLFQRGLTNRRLPPLQLL